MRFLSLLLMSLAVSTVATVNLVQAAPTFQAAGAAVSGTGAVNPAWPGGTAIDDIALLFIESTGGQPATLSTPAGFVAVANSPQATGTGTNGTQITVYWARATSTTMPTPRVADPGDHVYAQIITYRGVINTGDPWDVTGGGVKAAASTSVTVSGVTTTVPDTLIVQAVARDNDSAAAAFSAETNANLTGIAERSDAGTTSGNGGGFAIWDGVMATAGATGNTTATVTSSINAFLTIALKPQPPTVTSINLASPNPTSAGTAVSWTVVFSVAVTGVDATDFSLVQAGGVSGASITSVTGSGTTWTVTVNTGTGTGSLGLNLVDDDSIISSGGTPLGGAGTGNGDFTGAVYTVSPPFCTPPSNIPAGVTVTCQCDTFGRASLNPSTIFGGNWNVSTGATDTTGIVPYINSTTGHLRLTENSGNNAKAATVPGIFPASGNYISVEFNHYAFYGSATGADGIAVTLSDYSVPAVPGGFGGSLGYAQRTDSTPNPPGFAGGWIGVALDEYGNYQNPTEGRVGGPGFIPESVGVRGPGSGINGYRWMGGTGGNPGGLRIDTANRTSTTPGPGYMYQVIVDARDAATGTVNVSVNRDSATMDGSNYVSLFGPFNAYTEANYALSQGWISQVVPNFWTISFTGSTGGSTNVHEIGSLRICAQSIIPPSGGTASGFSAIDEAYPTAPSSTAPAYQNFQSGHIYMKLMGTPFKLWVAALTSSGISTGYSATGNKYVSVKLVDNSDNACGPDSARTCNSTCTNKAAVETGATQIATFPSGSSTGVASPSPTFTLNSAWKNLIAVMKECTTSACTAFTATAPACSADSFSVRPTGITSVTSSNATNTGTTGSPVFKAGADNFSLTATIAGVAGNPGGYTGTPKINSASGSLLPVGPATNAGTLAGSFAAATSGTGNSTATGTGFTYNEAGAFRLRAPDFTVPRIPGVYDDSWTAIDSDPLKNDCNSGTTAAAYSNTKDANGKYGCNFGITADTGGFGRFIPAYFDVSYIHGCLGATSFTYSRQPFGQVMVTARAAGGTTTKNYDYYGGSGFSKNVLLSDGGGSTAGAFQNGNFDASGFANGVQSKSNVSYQFTTSETPPLTLVLRAAENGGDGVSSVGHETAANQAEIRGGRIHLFNAYGSELASLLMPMKLEYYSAADGWVPNASDACTAVALANLDLQNAIDNPAQGVATININNGPPVKTSTVTVTTPSAGVGSLSFSAPGSGGYGYADARVDLTAQSWLRFDWDGNGTDDDPSARANFGLYRGSPKHIYMRERFN
jgi:MSHA biogenesis protein MshQ